MKYLKIIKSDSINPDFDGEWTLDTDIDMGHVLLNENYDGAPDGNNHLFICDHSLESLLKEEKNYIIFKLLNSELYVPRHLNAFSQNMEIIKEESLNIIELLQDKIKWKKP